MIPTVAFDLVPEAQMAQVMIK